MNTEANQENSAVSSTGERLRSAREKMGLTQQNIAERLCLKLSTIRDIEEDNSPAELASTFVRGYIRSYARLVHVPEEELLPMLAKQAPLKTAKVEPMQSFSLGKRRKKRDGWLMIFTWLVLFIIVGLSGAWWWQNHKAAQQDIISLGQQNQDSSDKTQSIAPSESTANSSLSTPAQSAHNSQAGSSNTPLAPPAADNQPSSTQTQAQVNQTQSAANVNINSTNDSTAVVPPALAASGSDASAPNSPQAQPVHMGEANASLKASTSALVMDFNNDCWLDVTDASGKKLFSGMQRSGGKLSLAGKPPYRLKIGAPAAVKIQFEGKPVDLSRFIHSNQVARLTLGAH